MWPENDPLFYKLKSQMRLFESGEVLDLEHYGRKYQAPKLEGLPRRESKRQRRRNRHRKPQRTFQLNIDPQWLLAMAEKEDGRIVSVGGFFTRDAEPIDFNLLYGAPSEDSPLFHAQEIASEYA